MSRRELPHDISFASTTALRNLMAEVAQLGIEFRISGAAVVIDGMEQLPDLLRRELERHRASGRLWDYLGGWVDDAPAVAFGDTLGVAVRLVETKADARVAVRQLIADSRKFGGCV